MSGPTMLTRPWKCSAYFDQLEQGTKILREKKRTKKKKKWGKWIELSLDFILLHSNTITEFLIPFFFWKKWTMRVILRPWSWGALRSPCTSQGLTVGMLPQLPLPARVMSYCQSRLAVGTG